MKCLRCGYCCKNYLVVVVDDPSKGIQEDNLIAHLGDGSPCKHLQGDSPGQYKCAIHDEPFYDETPCFNHSQIERKDSPCRMGVYVLEKQKEKQDAYE